MANNIELTRDGTRLVISIDLAVDGERSKSGKTTVLASTKGNIDVPGAVGLRLGVNLYGYDGFSIDTKPVGIRRTA